MRVTIMPSDRHMEDMIDAALADTFPASDPPFFVASAPDIKARAAAPTHGRTRSAADDSPAKNSVEGRKDRRRSEAKRR
jgi:hypothetical protein